MTTSTATLSKEEQIALNDVTLNGAFFPIFIMYVFVAVLTIIAFTIIGMERVELLLSSNDSITMYIVIALITNAVLYWLTAKFLVAKSLFKPRKKGVLILNDNAQFSSYIMKWTSTAFATSTVLGLIIILIEIAIEAELPMAVPIIIAWSSAFMANMLVANKMISNNDATIELK